MKADKLQPLIPNYKSSKEKDKIIKTDSKAKIKSEIKSDTNIKSEEAARYYKMAADKGHTFSMYKYAGMLQNGIGVKADMKEAARYYKLAAYRGNECGLYNYGKIIYNGEVIDENPKDALWYYKHLFQLA